LQRIAAIDHTWQPPHVPKQQPEFTDSLLNLRLEAFLRQHRASSTGVKRVLTKVAKFKNSILIGSIVLSLGLAGTQVYGDLASLLSERFPVLSNQQWWPIKK
jgi:hypothetical protein